MLYKTCHAPSITWRDCAIELSWVFVLQLERNRMEVVSNAIQLFGRFCHCCFAVVCRDPVQQEDCSFAVDSNISAELDEAFVTVMFGCQKLCIVKKGLLNVARIIPQCRFFLRPFIRFGVSTR
eukprot:TRINITY_DN9984_c0_g2_i3.p3 TRINITY_DN9984_c0_g2~~TRINITY_DN9984_c0_g2_i3.p3  ORF type:complete len:123 (-),score=1.29 TRINITY_DN9984_c0_g2_i3:40-408(-)